MTRTLLGALIGLCCAFAVRDLTTTLHILLGAAGGVSGAVLWWRRQAKSEAEQRLYREALVAAGYHAAKGASDLLTAQRCALPPREP
jgi:hypothetical protein